MPQPPGHLRSDADPLVMVGRLLAGQTHELTNVLSIVLELSGLLEDYAAPHGGTRDGDRLSSVADRLRRQALRGQALIKDLNQLAHTVDHDQLSVDLGEVVPLAERLVSRFARLKRVDVTWAAEGGGPAIVGDPHRTLHALVALGEGAVARASSTSAVVVTARIDGGRLVAEATIPDPDEAATGHRSQVAPPATGCDLRWQTDTAPPTLHLNLDPSTGGDP